MKLRHREWRRGSRRILRTYPPRDRMWEMEANGITWIKLPRKCKSMKCKKKYLEKIGEDNCIDVFTKIHDIPTKNEQDIFLQGLIDIQDIKRRYARKESPRTARLPSRRTGVDSRRGRSLIFACANRARRCRWSADFLGDLPFPHPFIAVVMHTHIPSHSSTLKPSTDILPPPPCFANEGGCVIPLHSGEELSDPHLICTCLVVVNGTILTPRHFLRKPPDVSRKCHLDALVTKSAPLQVTANHNKPQNGWGNPNPSTPIIDGEEDDLFPREPPEMKPAQRGNTRGNVKQNRNSDNPARLHHTKCTQQQQPTSKQLFPTHRILNIMEVKQPLTQRIPVAHASKMAFLPTICRGGIRLPASGYLPANQQHSQYGIFRSKQ
ncbi:hypothetical protein PR048_018114 [Dryococelus australis]|uniref:Uncharacterized protein n=1 Tax=Dryococelus australis TaxID=614101 RepID=A0ABQ9HBG6_9NEOP|nr:hypothetical protein PR048_018114 [Dryococelus australis]